MKKNKVTYTSILLSAISGAFFVLLNAVLIENSFLSLSLFNALLYLGTSISGTGLAFLLGFLVNFNVSKAFCAFVSAVISCPIYAIMKK